MVVLSRQYTEKYMLFLQFSAGGLHDWGILLVIPLEFQEIKHQPLPMAQPRKGRRAVPGGIRPFDDFLKNSFCISDS